MDIPTFSFSSFLSSSWRLNSSLYCVPSPCFLLLWSRTIVTIFSQPYSDTTIPIFSFFHSSLLVFGGSSSSPHFSWPKTKASTVPFPFFLWWQWNPQLYKHQWTLPAHHFLFILMFSLPALHFLSAHWLALQPLYPVCFLLITLATFCFVLPYYLRASVRLSCCCHGGPLLIRTSKLIIPCFSSCHRPHRLAPLSVLLAAAVRSILLGLEVLSSWFCCPFLLRARALRFPAASVEVVVQWRALFCSSSATLVSLVGHLFGTGECSPSLLLVVRWWVVCVVS